MPQLPPASQTGRLRVLNISQHFYSGQAPINAQFDRNDYKRFAALADVVGFDMYPIVKFCGRVPLTDMFHAQRELMTTVRAGEADVPVDRDEPDDGRVPDARRSRRRSSTPRPGLLWPAVRAASATSRTAGRATSGIAGTSRPASRRRSQTTVGARATPCAGALRRAVRRRRRALERHRRGEHPHAERRALRYRGQRLDRRDDDPLSRRHGRRSHADGARRGPYDQAGEEGLLPRLVRAVSGARVLAAPRASGPRPSRRTQSSPRERRYVERNPESRRLHEARARGDARREHAHGHPCRRRSRSRSSAAKARDSTDADGHLYLDFLGEYTAGLSATRTR